MEKKEKHEHPEVMDIQNICDITPEDKSTQEICDVVKKDKTPQKQPKKNPESDK